VAAALVLVVVLRGMRSPNDVREGPVAVRPAAPESLGRPGPPAPPAGHGPPRRESDGPVQEVQVLQLALGPETGDAIRLHGVIRGETAPPRDVVPHATSPQRVRLSFQIPTELELYPEASPVVFTLLDSTGRERAHLRTSIRQVLSGRQALILDADAGVLGGERYTLLCRVTEPGRPPAETRYEFVTHPPAR
jgi:hypothetical protein